MRAKKLVFGMLTVGLLASTQLVWAGEQSQKREPDYTKGEKWEALRDKRAREQWYLGTIGALGNFYAQRANVYTRDTRTIQISRVLKGPATGVLREQDVILGVISPTPAGSKKQAPRFTWDVRKALAAAIAEAERKENKGKLILNVWRPETEIVEIPLTDSSGRPLQGKALAKAKKEGKKSYKRILKKPLIGTSTGLSTGTSTGLSTSKTIQLTLTLPVKGSYSATSPWNCEKTKTMIDDEAQAIIKRGFFTTHKRKGLGPRGDIPDYLDALGLLATGEEKYLPIICEYARAIASQSEGLDIMKNSNGVSSWNGGYRNLFLCEYYLATKDEKVLPGITALSTFMAMGQSGVGTWSHGMSYVKLNGLYGPASAYGAMSSASLPIAISLVLAQKCGIKKKAVDDAVQRSLTHFRWYVDKGNIPYGDHLPAPSHDNNGKNSMAAVFFDLAGEKKTADFFTRMTVASYDEREQGHAGHFFSWQWGALGAARGGSAAAQSFAKKTRWFTELERRPDGIARHNQKTYYKDWIRSGSRLMQYCIPRKKLYITGKGGSSFSPITGKDLEELEAAALFKFTPSKLSVKELLTSLGSVSYQVRRRASIELGDREKNVVEVLIAMLDSPNRYARYGACEALSYAGRKSEAAIDALVNKLQTDKDLTMRRYAVIGLSKRDSRRYKNSLGELVVERAGPALLKQATIYEPELDPMRKLHNEISYVLFQKRAYFPGGAGAEKLDRSLLFSALKSLLSNPNGYARSHGSTILSYMSKDDLEKLWGDLYYAAKIPAPSGVMGSGGAVKRSLRLLSENRFKEALPVAWYLLKVDKWGRSDRRPAALDALLCYGSAFKKYMPEVKQVRKASYKGVNQKSAKEMTEKWDTLIKTVDKTYELKSIAPYLKDKPAPKAVMLKEDK